MPSLLIERGKRLLSKLAFRDAHFAGAYVEYSAFAKCGFWLFEIVLLTADLLGVFDAWLWTHKLLKVNTLRELMPVEVRLLQPLFPQLQLKKIRIDERAKRTTGNGRWTYVSGYLIKRRGALPNSTLVHEAVHIQQYQQYGAVFIARCLAAQASSQGYDYRMAIQAHSWEDFNWEQQAAFIEDIWRKQQHLNPLFPESDEGRIASYQEKAELWRTKKGDQYVS